MLESGERAPEFALEAVNHENSMVRLKDLRGSRVVLFFYPRDDTPGCSREACAFSDARARLRRHGVLVFGISGDSGASHERFIAKHDLSLPLLVDPGYEVAAAYGAFGEKTLYGRKVRGVIRSTFLIDAEGRIERVWSPVRVDGHVEQVLEALVASAGSAKADSAGNSGKAAKKSTKKVGARRKKARATKKKMTAAGGSSGATEKKSTKKTKKSTEKPGKEPVKKLLKKPLKKKVAMRRKARG